MKLEKESIKPKRVGLAKSKRGATLFFGATLFVLSPVVLVVLTTPLGGNPFGGGAALWFLMYTVPLGVIPTYKGLAQMLTGINYSLRIKTPAASAGHEVRSEILREKAISMALLVAMLLVASPVICIVVMILGPIAVTVSIFTSAVLAGTATAICLVFALQSQVPKLQLVLSIISVIFLVVIFLEAQALFSFLSNLIESRQK